MTYEFYPRGVCSRKMVFEIENGVVKDLEVVGGCNGNTQGVAKLAVGRPAQEVIDLLKDTDCNGRGTSCPDQLAKALKEAIKQAM